MQTGPQSAALKDLLEALSVEQLLEYIQVKYKAEQAKYLAEIARLHNDGEESEDDTSSLSLTTVTDDKERESLQATVEAQQKEIQALKEDNASLRKSLKELKASFLKSKDTEQLMLSRIADLSMVRGIMPYVPPIAVVYQQSQHRRRHFSFVETPQSLDEGNAQSVTTRTSFRRI